MTLDVSSVTSVVSYEIRRRKIGIGKETRRRKKKPGVNTGNAGAGTVLKRQNLEKGH
jgi:hypothetical protein